MLVATCLVYCSKEAVSKAWMAPSNSPASRRRRTLSSCWRAAGDGPGSESSRLEAPPEPLVLSRGKGLDADSPSSISEGGGGLGEGGLSLWPTATRRVGPRRLSESAGTRLGGGRSRGRGTGQDPGPR